MVQYSFNEIRDKIAACNTLEELKDAIKSIAQSQSKLDMLDAMSIANLLFFKTKELTIPQPIYPLGGIPLDHTKDNAIVGEHLITCNN